MAREAEVDGRVDERLHDQEDVGGPGPAHGGRHGHEPLVVDLDLMAEGVQQRAGLGALLRGRARRRVPDRHPATQPGRRVRHAPDDLLVAEEPDERRGRGAGDDRQDELAAPQLRADLAADPGEHLGLDREEDHVGARRRPRRSTRSSGSRTAARAPPAARRAGGWRRPGSGSTRAPRSRPAIIASAMTPEPTVAIVRFDRGDMAASIPAAGLRRCAADRRLRRGPRRLAEEEEPGRRADRGRLEAGGQQRGLELVRRVEDLGDRERAPVGERPLDGRHVGPRPVVDAPTTTGRGASR